MNTKLTLLIDDEIIRRAKDYAKSHRISISSIIEKYLDAITMKKSSDIEITSLVKSLTGVIKIDEDFDYKIEYGNYLREKYK